MKFTYYVYTPLIKFLGFGVKLLTKPTIRRSQDKIVISGCSYSSARNISLQNFAYYFYGESTIGKLDSTDNSEVQNGNIYTFSDFTFPYYMASGNFSCRIWTGQEIFTSNATTVYNQPGNFIFVNYMYMEYFWYSR